VTRALQNLAESRFANQAVFKGGTSLSKACGVGYRFSEDIDIAITSDDGRSENQTKTLVGGIGKAILRSALPAAGCGLSGVSGE
jgi:predicted nucleotidyltransferase component of viral defense system